MSERIFGIHSIEEAMDSGQEIDKIFIQKGLDSGPLGKIIARANQANIALSFVPVQKLNKLVNGNHQGIIAQISPIQTVSLEMMVETAFSEAQNPLFILLDGISDVRNFGAIIRTAESAGAQGIIIPNQGSAAINEQAVKTSAGAIFNIPICRASHLKDALYFLQSYDVQIVSASEKASQTLYEIDFKKPTALVMGSEGDGVSKSLLKLSDHQAKLPMLGKTESLNVSVACALFMYEAVRQKMD